MASLFLYYFFDDAFVLVFSVFPILILHLTGPRSTEPEVPAVPAIVPAIVPALLCPPAPQFNGAWTLPTGTAEVAAIVPAEVPAVAATAIVPAVAAVQANASSASSGRPSTPPLPREETVAMS